MFPVHHVENCVQIWSHGIISGAISWGNSDYITEITSSTPSSSVGISSLIHPVTPQSNVSFETTQSVVNMLLPTKVIIAP